MKSCFNDQEVASIANDLMIAAAVTTSYTALWTMYLLGINPEEQKSNIPVKSKQPFEFLSSIWTDAANTLGPWFVLFLGHG